MKASVFDSPTREYTTIFQLHTYAQEFRHTHCRRAVPKVRGLERSYSAKLKGYRFGLDQLYPSGSPIVAQKVSHEVKLQREERVMAANSQNRPLCWAHLQVSTYMHSRYCYRVRLR